MRGNTFDLAVLWVATIGQVLFVILWATQRWWSSNVGRALMASAAFLAILLSMSLWGYYRGPISPTVGRSIFTGWAVAIVAQLVVFVVELRRARRDRSGVLRDHE